MNEGLRFTETNSGDDSQGRTWGLEGNLFWFMAGGAFAFVMVLLVCFSALKMSFFVSLIIALVPLILCVVYVFMFRQGKPAGYDVDCLDHWMNGSGFSPEWRAQPKHPLYEISKD
jgi:fatty acid desaturase